MAVLMLVWEFVSLWFFPSVGRLGDPDYRTRDRACREVSVWAAYPLLRRAADYSPDAEVRGRARVLAGRVEWVLSELRAGWCLVGPEPHGPSFYADHALRLRVLRMCERCEIGPAADRERLHPDKDPEAFLCWMWDQPVWSAAAKALGGVRKTVGRGTWAPDDWYEVGDAP